MIPPMMSRKRVLRKEGHAHSIRRGGKITRRDERVTCNQSDKIKHTTIMSQTWFNDNNLVLHTGRRTVGMGVPFFL